MRARGGDVRARVEVHAHHDGVVQKRQAVARRAEVAPIGGEDALRAPRHADGIQHAGGGVGGEAQEAPVLLFHDGIVGATEHLVRIVEGRCGVVHKLVKGPHAFARTGAGLLHSVGERFAPEGHAHVVAEFARSGGDGAERVGHGAPVDALSHAEVVEDVPEEGAGVRRRSEVAQLVQSGFKFEAPPLEAAGASSGGVVLFGQEHLEAKLGEARGCHEAAVSGADHNRVVLHESSLRVKWGSCDNLIIGHSPDAKEAGRGRYVRVPSESRWQGRAVGGRCAGAWAWRRGWGCDGGNAYWRRGCALREGQGAGFGGAAARWCGAVCAGAEVGRAGQGGTRWGGVRVRGSGTRWGRALKERTWHRDSRTRRLPLRRSR